MGLQDEGSDEFKGQFQEYCVRNSLTCQHDTPALELANPLQVASESEPYLWVSIVFCILFASPLLAKCGVLLVNSESRDTSDEEGESSNPEDSDVSADRFLPE